jgi:tRNA/tmRNA/rRNA uracil-C5-methylase (TrmA/RlmC/RlmD family)
VSPVSRSSGRQRRYAGPRKPAGPRGESLVGEVFEVEVGPVAHGGFCVARHDGRVVFVRHTLPGERVRAKVTEGGSEDRFLRADAVEVLSPSADRVDPVCRHAGPGGCGGCDWQHVDLAAQRRLKGAVVAEQLWRLAGIDRSVEVLPVPGDVDGFGWRTRVEFAVDRAGRAGLRPTRSHAVLPIMQCPIADPRVLASGVLADDWSGAKAVDVVAPSGGGAVVVVPIPAAAGSVPEIRERVESASWTGEFDVSARGFWQVHPGAAATFVDRVLAELNPRPGERVLDLYAGVGLFAVPLADAVGPGGAVLAVEGDVLACELAVRNAGNRTWIEVVPDRVEEVLASTSPDTWSSADLVVLDPPRTGAGRAVIEVVARLQPRAVAYVACDPAALARDLGYAREAGYVLGGLTAYDAFPMTHHLECIAVLKPT